MRIHAGRPGTRPAPQGATHQMLPLLPSRIMARTTIDLDASVLDQLRRRAAAEHKSMGQLASEQLAISLREKTSPPQPLRWPTRPMGKPTVDLQDKDAVLRALDGEQRHTR